LELREPTVSRTLPSRKGGLKGTKVPLQLG
jgi:hypothetical protein